MTLGRGTRAAAALASALAAFFGAREAGAARVHVRGQARVEAQAARDAGDLILSGALTDDAGQPLAGESVAVSLAREADPSSVFPLSDEQHARSCSSAVRDATGAPRPAGAGGPVVLVTDESGRFCVRVSAPRDKYVASIAWGGTALVDGAKLDLPVDTGRQAITLRFDPEPRVVSLDKDALAFQVVASYEENQTTHAGASLPVVVTDERGVVLASDVTGGGGTLRVEIPTERLGPPGHGELRASFPGSDELTKSVHIAPIERRARVKLDARADASKPVSPEDGIPIAVTARTRAGGAAGGTIEARVGDAVVGAATLEGGAAGLVATFALPDGAAREIEVRVRYLPSAPWLEAGDEAIVRVPVKGPSPWREVPLALAGLAVVAWLALGRFKRASPRARASTLPPKPALEGEAHVDVIQPTRDPRAGWRGRVVDAHDGTPVRAARLRVERPGFERAQVISSAFADDDGRFELKGSPVATNAGFDELVVDAPLHAELRQPLPSCGQLEVALVLRKRKLLERLAQWAKRRGRPFDASPEATPGHVRRAAAGDFATARWADAVERAAYGGGAVDARAEAEIDRLAPDPAKPKGSDLTVRDVPPDAD